MDIRAKLFSWHRNWDADPRAASEVLPQMAYGIMALEAIGLGEPWLVLWEDWTSMGSHLSARALLAEG